MNILTVLTSESGSMFNRKWTDIGGAIYDFFCKMLYSMTIGICSLLHYISCAFYFLIGDTSKFKDMPSLFPTYDSQGGFDAGIIFGNSSTSQPFFQEGTFLLNVENPLVKTILYILVVGFIILTLSLLWGFYKASNSSNQRENGVEVGKATITNSLKALIMMVVAPIFVIITIGVVTSGINLLMGGISTTLLGSDESLGMVVYRSCFYDYGSKISGYLEHQQYLLNEDGILGITFPDLESEIENWTFIDGEWVQGKSLGKLYEIYNFNLTGTNVFNYMFGFIGGIFSVVALGLLVIRLAERVFEVVSDYLYCIPAIATYPADNGQRFNTWLELFSGRLLSFLGSYIGMLLYIYVIKIVQPIITSQFKTGDTMNVVMHNITYSCIFLVLVIGGAFATVKGGNMVSQLIGQRAGQAEANSFQQSMGLYKMGTHAVEKAGKVALGATAAFGAGMLRANAQQKLDEKGKGGSGGSSGGGSATLGNIGQQVASMASSGSNGVNSAISKAPNGFKQAMASVGLDHSETLANFNSMRHSGTESRARYGKGNSFMNYAGALTGGVVHDAFNVGKAGFKGAGKGISKGINGIKNHNAFNKATSGLSKEDRKTLKSEIKSGNAGNIGSGFTKSADTYNLNGKRTSIGEWSKVNLANNNSNSESSYSLDDLYDSFSFGDK